MGFIWVDSDLTSRVRVGFGLGPELNFNNKTFIKKKKDFYGLHLNHLLILLSALQVQFIEWKEIYKKT